MDAVAARLAAIFRTERLRQGLSMNAVAERGGLSQQMVSYVERGIRQPGFDTMLRIADALGIDLGESLQRAQRSDDAFKTK